MRLKLSITPVDIKMMPPMIENGISSRMVTLVRSTQKLPSRSVLFLVKPRTSAIATTMPTPAERKFCTARAAIWVT